MILPKRTRFPASLPGVLFTLLLLGVYADPLFLRKNFGGRDLVAYNLPMENAIHEAYSRGRLPVWMTEVSGGRPLLPNPNAGALYPVRPLLSLIPFPLAVRIYPVLHWALAGIGMIVLLRSLGVSPAAAWIGAVTYAFSGVAVSEVIFPHVQPGMALLPWIIWALSRRGGTQAARVLLLSLFFGLIFLAAEVFSISLAILCAFLWIGLEVERPARGRALLCLAVSLLLALLLAAPQILATALWIPETNRAVLGMKLEEALFFSIAPLRLLEFLAPFPFGATWSVENARIWGWPLFRGRPLGLHATLYAGALAVIALATAARSRLPGARFARALFLLGLLFSLSPSLLPERWGRFPSPLPLRNPEKFAVALTLALAVFAGIGLDELKKSRRVHWPLILGGIFAGLAAVAALFPQIAGQAAIRLVGAPERFAAVASGQLPGSLAEGGLLWMATVVALDLLRRPDRPALLVSLLLLTAVPPAANRKIARTFRDEEIFAPTAFARTLQRLDPVGGSRTLAETVYRPDSTIQKLVSESDPTFTEFPRRLWEDHTHAFWTRGTVFNYDFDVGDLSRLESLRRVSRLAARHERGDVFFGSLALKWGIRFRDQPPLPGYRRFGGDTLQDWDEHPGALPDIRLVERWREKTGAVAALNTLSRLEPGEIVLETGRDVRGEARPGGLRIVERSPERLVLETEASDPSWLFVLRGFWEHRTVLRDGEPVEVIPAQLAFSAIPVPPGRHRVVWREEVPGFQISRWGPALFLLATVFLTLRGWRKKRTP